MKKQKNIVNFTVTLKIVQKRKSNYSLLQGSAVKSIYIVIVTLKLTIELNHFEI